MSVNVVDEYGRVESITHDAGFTPAQRDNRYRHLKIHTGPESPDLKVTDWSSQRAKKLHVESQPAPGDEGKNGTVGLTVEGESRGMEPSSQDESNR